MSKDYENGFLFYNKDEEKRWKALALKKNLDPNVDVRPRRKRTAGHWLRPLGRVPDSYYLEVAKACSAKPVGQDGRRPHQALYFNGVKEQDPRIRTLAGVCERIMRREAVINTIRWLMVDNKESSPNSMEDFFRISVRKYLPRGKEQLDKFAELLDSKIRTKWSTPQREKVLKLKDICDLIPPFIKVHYQVVAAGGQGHNAPSIRGGVANTANWEWQLHVQRPGQSDREEPLLI